MITVLYTVLAVFGAEMLAVFVFLAWPRRISLSEMR